MHPLGSSNSINSHHVVRAILEPDDGSWECLPGSAFDLGVADRGEPESLRVRDLIRR